MKLLVTGGAGFIGSAFVRLALSGEEPLEIVNLDKLTYAGNLENLKAVAEHERYRFVHGDICDAPLVNDLFAREKPAAVVGVRLSLEPKRTLSRIVTVSQ